MFQDYIERFITACATQLLNNKLFKGYLHPKLKVGFMAAALGVSLFNVTGEVEENN